MTKEQILEKHAKVRIFDNLYTGNEIVSCQCVLPAMEEYAKQQLSAERERSKKLVQCAESLLFLHGCEQEGLSSGKPSFADWIHATNNLQNEIDRFKSTDPETTGNQEVTNPST